jgi:hypothetical protein
MTKNEKIELGVVAGVAALLLFLWWEKHRGMPAAVQTVQSQPFQMPALTSANFSVPAVQGAPDYSALLSALAAPSAQSLPGSLSFDTQSFPVGTGQNSTPWMPAPGQTNVGCSGGCTSTAIGTSTSSQSSGQTAPAPLLISAGTQIANAGFM